MKTAILVDSVAGFKKDITDLPYVFQANLTVNFPDGTTMEDTIELDIIDEYFEKIEKYSELPSTSQPSFGQLHTIYDQIIAEGYTRVIGLALSSQLSGTYSAFVTTAEDYADKIESHHFDSLTAAIVEEKIVKDMLPLIENEASIDEIAAIVKHHQEKSHLYVVVETLTNLRKGGRLTASSALLGTLLNVKPLLTISSEGKLVVHEKVRTSKRVAERIVKIALDAIEEYQEKISFTLLYTDSTSIKTVESIKERIQAQYPNVPVLITIVSPVISTHIGKGAYGIGVFPEI